MKICDLSEVPWDLQRIGGDMPAPELRDLAACVMARCWNGKTGKRDAESAGVSVAVAVHRAFGLGVSCLIRRSNAGYRVQLSCSAAALKGLSRLSWGLRR